MALQDMIDKMLGTQGMSPEEQEFIRRRAMLSAGANMLSASAPRVGGPPVGGIGGAMQALGPGVQGMYQGAEAARESMAPKKTSLPFKSAAIQAAMVELGVDPTDPASYTAKNITAANNILQRRKVEVAGATGRARAISTEEVSREFPLKPNEVSDFVLPGTLTPVPLGTTAPQLEAMGAIKVSPQQKQQIAALETSKLLIDEIDSLSKGLITATNPGEVANQLATLHVGAFTGANPTAKAYKNAKESFLGVIARTIGGERGVMTDRDVFRIDKAFPGFSDTVDSRNLKILLLRNMYDVSATIQKRVAFGGDAATDSEKRRIQKNIEAMESGDVKKMIKASQGEAGASAVDDLLEDMGY